MAEAPSWWSRASIWEKWPPLNGQNARHFSQIGDSTRSRYPLVERVAAGAGALGVRVVDGETLRVDPVREVDRRAAQVRRAHPVDDDLEPVVLGDLVAVQRALVEEQL